MRNGSLLFQFFAEGWVIYNEKLLVVMIVVNQSFGIKVLEIEYIFVSSFEKMFHKKNQKQCKNRYHLSRTYDKNAH